MADLVFRYQSEMPVSAEKLYAWHLRSGAFARLTPPWEPVQLVQADSPLREGAIATLKIPIGPFWKEWVAEHGEFIPGQQFVDRQRTGPFARWSHFHRMEPLDLHRSLLVDEIRCAPPGGTLGRWLSSGMICRKLERMFRYRHDLLRDDLRAAARTHAGPQRILVSGSSGLVGTALCALLTTGGHDVVRLVRDRKLAGNPAFRCWDPAHGQISVADLEQFDAVIHLGGEGIADGRWSPEKKRRLKDSRVIPTRLLCESLAKCERPPKVVVVASATGYYGDRGDELLTEQSDLGNGFLPEICRAWEEAASPASAAGIRTVNVRIGVVLTPAGGALAKMLPIFRWGGGGRLGNGRQWMSVISLDDLIGLIGHALVHPELSGPVNAVLPEPVTNAEFTRTLGRVLHRPAMLPVPKTAIRIVAGEMADALLFASTRAVPQRALESGYQFRHATLEQALRHVLGAQPPTSEHQTDCSCVTHAE